MTTDNHSTADERLLETILDKVESIDDSVQEILDHLTDYVDHARYPGWYDHCRDERD